MEPVKWLTSALGATAAVKTAVAQKPHVPHKADARPVSQDSMDWSHWLEMMPAQNMPMAQMQKMREAMDVPVRRQSGQSFEAAWTQHNQCMDVKNNNMNNGGLLQIWQCSGTPNQQWRFEGPLFQTNDNLCLDLPNGQAYDGAPLQVWACDSSNPHQHWNHLGSTLRWNGGQGDWCVDVTNGAYYNGNQLQLWQCFAGNAHQAFTFSAPPVTQVSQGNTPNTAATTWLGYNCISLDAFVQKYPACAQYESALQAAGSDNGINPTFLGAISMVESGCNCFPGNADGPFQFMDDNAWNFYGGYGKNRQNFWDAAYGAARYFKALLAQDSNNLFQAMRDWNGPVSQGGDPNYQQTAAAYMAGTE